MGALIALAPLIASGVPPFIDMVKGIITAMQADPAATAEQQAALQALADQLDATNTAVQAVAVWAPPPSP